MTDTGKHTPGPWGVTKHIGSTQYEVGQEKNRRKAVAVVKTQEDARLIAAAPELLEALKGLVAQCDLACLVERDHETPEFVEALITALEVREKAEGSDV